MAAYSEILTHAIQPTLNIVSSAGVLAASTVASALFLNYVLLPDNTPVNIVQQDAKKITEVPPVVPSAKPGAKPSKEQIVLPQGFDITNYRIQDLKADRSFIRAFYFIRFNKDPPDEELNTFVQTDVIDTFNSYGTDKIQRVFNVMHFCGKNEQAPYLTFCKIRTEASKMTSKKLITIEDLLNVSQISDNMFRMLKTTTQKVSKLLEIIKEIQKKNGAFLILDVNEQQKLMDQYAVISPTNKPDNDSLELFKTLSVLIRDKKTLYDILTECLKDECKNLSQNEEHKKNDLRYKDFIKTLSNNKTKREVNFPYRCGVGDMLAEAKPKVCVTHIKEEENQHHNYGCDDRNLVYPNNYIIYMDKYHHCVFLIPNSIAPAPNKVKLTEPPIAKSPTSGVNPALKTKINAASTVQNPCVEHDKLFLEGGRKRTQKRGTKSQRKGTRRI